MNPPNMIWMEGDLDTRDEETPSLVENLNRRQHVRWSGESNDKS